jgi:hypothetical protein
MLKLKLLFNLIKQNWKLAIYIILFLLGFKFYWNLRSEIRAGQRWEHNLKANMIRQWQEDSLALVAKAQIIDSLEGVLLAKLKVKVKSDTVKITAIGHGEGKEKSFDWEDECFSAWGWFEVEPPYELEQFVMLKPFELEVLITDLYPDVYGKVSASNSCIGIDKVDFKVSPDIKGVKKDGFDFGDFALGGVIVGTGIIIINILR